MAHSCTSACPAATARRLQVSIRALVNLLHDMDVQKFQRQPVGANALDVEAGGQVAPLPVQWHVLIVDHPQIPGRIQPIQVFPVHANLFADNFLTEKGTG